MAMIYYNTLLFLIFAAMMLLANARFRVTHQAPQKICNYAACDRCLQKGVNNPVS